MPWIPLDGEALESALFMGVTIRMRSACDNVELFVNLSEVYAAQLSNDSLSVRLGSGEWFNLRQPEVFDFALREDEKRAAAIVAGLITDINAYRRDKNALTRDDEEPFDGDDE